MFLILGRLRQENYEFEASLEFIIIENPVSISQKKLDFVVHNYNPNPPRNQGRRIGTSFLAWAS